MMTTADSTTPRYSWEGTDGLGPHGSGYGTGNTQLIFDGTETDF